jgi:hypothetical protein
VTTAGGSPPTSIPPTTPATTTTVTPTTLTTVAPFDPALCGDLFYFLLHLEQCRALSPPPHPKNTTSTTNQGRN